MKLSRCEQVEQVGLDITIGGKKGVGIKVGF